MDGGDGFIVVCGLVGHHVCHHLACLIIHSSQFGANIIYCLRMYAMGDSAFELEGKPGELDDKAKELFDGTSCTCYDSD